jgi:hypothetical protein
MMIYNSFEEELDAIRLAIYEEIKDMTPEEEVAYINAQAAPILKEYGLRTVNQIKADEEMIIDAT